eukprot:8764280-Pyramimonas_sp.AAC.1
MGQRGVSDVFQIHARMFSLTRSVSTGSSGRAGDFLIAGGGGRRWIGVETKQQKAFCLSPLEEGNP